MKQASVSSAIQVRVALAKCTGPSHQVVQDALGIEGDDVVNYCSPEPTPASSKSRQDLVQATAAWSSGCRQALHNAYFESRDGARRRTCSPATRPGASPPTSPSC